MLFAWDVSFPQFVPAFAMELPAIELFEDILPFDEAIVLPAMAFFVQLWVIVPWPASIVLWAIEPPDMALPLDIALP
ncbi:MAG: hypothetical protein ACTHLR_17800 [Rhizomicrobium sp.]